MLAGRLPGLSETPVTLAGRLPGLSETPVTLAGRLPGLSKTPVMVAGRLPDIRGSHITARRAYKHEQIARHVTPTAPPKRRGAHFFSARSHIFATSCVKGDV